MEIGGLNPNTLTLGSLAPGAAAPTRETSADICCTDSATLSGAPAPTANPSKADPVASVLQAGVSVAAGTMSGPVAVAVSDVAAASAPKPADLTDRLAALLPDKPFVLSAERVQSLTRQLNCDAEQLLQALIPVAKASARPPISNYLVGAAGLGKSGAIYLGVNLEFPGNSLNQTVHGEQFVVTNALRNGEEQLTSLAVSAAPCGHCRQWLNETSQGSDLRILTPQKPPTPLNVLLPDSFGPGDLGVTAALLSKQDQKMTLESPAADDLTRQAFEAANASYAPYSHNGSGLALRLKDGSTYAGRYSENAAFNPSLSPLQGALIGMVADGRAFNEIAEVVLVERRGAKASQIASTRDVLTSLQPEAALRVAYAEALPEGK